MANAAGEDNCQSYPVVLIYIEFPLSLNAVVDRMSFPLWPAYNLYRDFILTNYFYKTRVSKLSHLP